MLVIVCDQDSDLVVMSNSYQYCGIVHCGMWFILSPPPCLLQLKAWEVHSDHCQA